MVKITLKGFSATSPMSTVHTRTSVNISFRLKWDHHQVEINTLHLTAKPLYILNSMQQSASWEASSSSASQNIPCILWNPKADTVLTRPHQLALSSASSIHSSRPRFPSGLFLQVSPAKLCYAFVFFPIRATCPANLIIIDLITWIISGEDWTSRNSLRNFLQPPVTSA
jgi:hypothetical protein